MYSILSICCFCLGVVSATTNITTTNVLRDPETLLSSNAIFKLGFFSPSNSTNRYIGIWYNLEDFDTQNVVWVANRNNPLNNSSGMLHISEDGSLRLSDVQSTVYWSSNVSHGANNSSVAQLLDTGNLVLMLSNGMIIWQSFEHLTDSLLSHTRVLADITVPNSFNEVPVLRSWKSASDPSIGHFWIGLILFPITEFVLREDDNIYWRSGPWNGSHFLGLRGGGQADSFRIVYKQPERTLDMLYSVSNESSHEYYVLSYDGNVYLKFWDFGMKKWQIGYQSNETECDIFGKCGPFGQCNPGDSPICSCINGFKPKNIDEWNEGNWTNGCVRMTQLQCGSTGRKADGFKKLPHMKVPDNISFKPANDEDDCRKNCFELCSCIAYAYPEGIGCMIWNDKLIDIQVLDIGGADLFIRLAYSELAEPNNKRTIIAVIITIATTTFIIFLYCLWSCIYQKHGKKMNNETQIVDSGIEQAKFNDLSMFKFQELEAATNNFSEINKLGRGGFGAVYKGKLENGQEIAVKRLSRASGQGLQEFMNEVLLISKLQHKNLVRLFGGCIEREEKLLVYEYMPNKSLDALLFDSYEQKQLNWIKRFNIINGICRGLLYLHRDSRLKIIHRDLKASNILLDEELNPKISDFGMARIFEAKQDQANTLRVVGTYGYMSPEYAMEGRFSEKSDVFSLGVLLLEIVSGRKNARFLVDESLSLLTYTWKLWNENNILSLVDPTIFDPCFKVEIMKCIQLGLLCVQEFPEDRPNISELLTMLDANDNTDLPLPTQPGFTYRRANSRYDYVFQSSQEYGSINSVSLTAISGR